MAFKTSLTAVVAVALMALSIGVFLATSMAHEGIKITNAYAITSGSNAKSVAIFMDIENHAAVDDRLIGVASDTAMRVGLHEHKSLGDGVMKMQEVVGGIGILANGSIAMASGGYHVMMMGLKNPLVEGKTFELTLTFEKAGTLTLTVPVGQNNASNTTHQMDGEDHMKMND